jgi:hypothetical protein
MRLDDFPAAMAGRLRQLFALLVMLTPLSAGLAAETVISKADVDLIFSMRKAEWEAYAPRVADPKWKIQFQQTSTGIGVMAFDPSTGTALSIQPLYLDDKTPQTMLVVGSFYPRGKRPAHLAAAQDDIEREAQQDLGRGYSVSARFVRPSPSLEGVEITVTRAENAPK